MTLLKRIAALLVVAAALPYLVTPVYRFPPPQAFRGAHLWNPYSRLTGTWQLANLHAHGRAWNGLTNGRQTDEEVVRAYKERGYSVAGISDYQSIASQHGVDTIPAYEHGYNIAKHHQLAIGARRVEWFDFPLWQGVSQTQYVVDRVTRTADLVAIVHPTSAYDPDDFHQLTGYQLMEVANGPFLADAFWDAALSSGHAVWAIANDDTHDVADARRMGVAWTMIDAPTPGAADVVSALRDGRMYAVSAPAGRRDPPEATLARFDLHDATIEVESTGEPATFLFIGQDGAVRKKLEGTRIASYTIAANDSYIRTEIRTANTAIFLNPVIRYDGATLRLPDATPNAPMTWAQRLLTVVSCLALVPVLWRRPHAAR